MKKISNIFLYIFSVGIILMLFGGGLSLFGYVAALIIGGDTAAAFCLWIFTAYLPVIIKITSVAVLFGLIGMYLTKKKALAVDSVVSEEEK